MQILRKYIPALLFSIIAIMPLLFSATFLILQYRAKQRIQQELASRDTQTIIVLLDKLHWLEEGKELLIDNKLFDVKSMVINGDRAELSGLFDITEQVLYNQLNSFMLAEEDETSGNTTESCFSISFGCDKHFFPDLSYLATASLSGMFNHTSVSLNTRPIAVLTPPPDC
jgi:hypothetical protein